VAFTTILNELPHSFFSSQFVEYLLNQFWPQAQRSIVIRQFLPYVLFICSSVYYMHLQLRDDDQGLGADWTNGIIAKKVLGIVSLMLLAYSVRTEILQLRS